MNVISLLKEEHNEIERELIELEKTLEDLEDSEDTSEVNFPNLLHTFRRLIDIWDSHEKEEEEIFPVLKSQEIAIEIEKILFEHKRLKKYKENLLKSINSGSVFEVRQSLKKDFPIIAKELRDHMSFEDEILYTAIVKNTSELEFERLRLQFPDLGKWLK